MQVKQLLFSAQGRIGRGEFWAATLSVYVLAALVGFSLYGLITNERTDDVGASQLIESIALFAVIVLFMWCHICIIIKRFHDRNKSGWWYLISFVPNIGFLWILVDCGILAGTIGANQYGADPRGGYSREIAEVFDTPR